MRATARHSPGGLGRGRPGAVLQRLGQVGRVDALGRGQVGDGARQLEHAVVGPRRELEAARRRHLEGA